MEKMMHKQGHLHGRMRTTISIDDDLIPSVKSFAQSRDISLGQAVSELVRRGLQAPLQTVVRNGLHVVVLPPGAAKVTAEHVRKLQDELD